MSTKYHLCHSVTGPLANWKLNDWKRATGYIKKDDGTKLTVQQLKEYFIAELSLGHEVIKTCACDNFDWKKGCMGHPVSDIDPAPPLQG